MNDEQISAKVCEIVNAAMGIKTAQPTTALESLETDSLDAIEICMTVEEEFNIEITDEQIKAVKTVQDITDLVKKIQAP